MIFAPDSRPKVFGVFLCFFQCSLSWKPSALRTEPNPEPLWRTSGIIKTMFWNMIEFDPVSFWWFSFCYSNWSQWLWCHPLVFMFLMNSALCWPLTPLFSFLFVCHEVWVWKEAQWRVSVSLLLLCWIPALITSRSFDSHFTNLPTPLHHR